VAICGGDLAVVIQPNNGKVVRGFFHSGNEDGCSWALDIRRAAIFREVRLAWAANLNGLVQFPPGLCWRRVWTGPHVGGKAVSEKISEWRAELGFLRHSEQSDRLAGVNSRWPLLEPEVRTRLWANVECLLPRVLGGGIGRTAGSEHFDWIPVACHPKHLP